MHWTVARISYGNMSGWVAGCPSQPRYCIKTTKPILKLFRPPGSPQWRRQLVGTWARAPLAFEIKFFSLGT